MGADGREERWADVTCGLTYEQPAHATRRDGRDALRMAGER